MKPERQKAHLISVHKDMTLSVENTKNFRVLLNKTTGIKNPH